MKYLNVTKLLATTSNIWIYATEYFNSAVQIFFSLNPMQFIF